MLDEMLTNQGQTEAAPVAEAAQATATENTTPAVEPTTPQSIRVKYNHQEMDIPYQDAIVHIQKGMNYDKAVERAQREARDKVYADMGYTWNGRPITTEAEYYRALQEQQLMEQYREQNLPEEIVREIVESKKFRESYHAQQAEIERQRQTQRMYQDFLDAYPDIKTEDIPAEVWAAVEKGANLTDAYVRHENRLLKAQLGQAAKGAAVEAANQANAASAPGSVKGAGTPTAYLSREQVEKMTQDEAYEKYALIQESMKYWK